MSGCFVDFYETLQISPNADPDTIHRVYRLLAQRFHPDQAGSGDAEAFRSISEAYRTLSDPEKRAAYDVRHREERRLTWRIFDQANSAQGIEAEKRKRQGVLELLYRKRTGQPDQPSMNLRDLEELLCIPKEHLEFTLWYLKEGQHIQRTDNARFTITLKGVDLVEEMTARRGENIPVAFIAAQQSA